MTKRDRKNKGLPQCVAELGGEGPHLVVLRVTSGGAPGTDHMPCYCWGLKPVCCLPGQCIDFCTTDFKGGLAFISGFMLNLGTILC